MLAAVEPAQSARHPLQKATVPTGHPVADPHATARAILRAALAEPTIVTGAALQRVPGGYARTFLFGDTEHSVWAFVWEPGAATPIHDHHCSCCFALLQGALVERWFTAGEGGQARLTHAVRREAGFLACMTPDGPNIHQMINSDEQPAISIHVYGFDPRRHANSVAQQYTSATD